MCQLSFRNIQNIFHVTRINRDSRFGYSMSMRRNKRFTQPSQFIAKITNFNTLFSGNINPRYNCLVYRRTLVSTRTMWHKPNHERRNSSGYLIVFARTWLLQLSFTANMADHACYWAGSSVGIATEPRTGRSGIESRWRRDFPPVQTGPETHPASCKMGTGSFPGVKCGRGVLLTTHPLLVPRSWKSRAVPLPTLWAKPGL